MPVFAVAATLNSLSSSEKHRVVSNPFVNNPTALEILAIESIAMTLRSAIVLRIKSLDVCKFRKNASYYGTRFDIKVPSHCTIIELSNYLNVETSTCFHTEPNGQGPRIELSEGVCFIAALNQAGVDGGIILRHFGDGKFAFLLSQSKFTLEHVPSTGNPPLDESIAQGEANTILSKIRAQGQPLLRLFNAKEEDCYFVYDIFTTRAIGARLKLLETPFALKKNEFVMLTTRETVKEALGPIFSVRSKFQDEI